MPGRWVLLVDGVKYRQIDPTARRGSLWGKMKAYQQCWLAVDGSKKMIVGPEELTDDCGFKGDYYYVSALGDYYRGDYCVYRYGMWMCANSNDYNSATFVIHTDETGFIEDMLLTGEGPIGKLEKMTFKLKDLVEKEKGKKLTVLDQIKWFLNHPTVKMRPCAEKERRDRMLKVYRSYPNENTLFSLR